MRNNSLGSFAVMDYMKVINRLQDPYVAAEKAWKPVHQERIKQKIIQGWYLYKVHFAYDDNPYNFTTLNTYEAFSQLENPYPREIIANIHPDKGYDGFEDLTEEARRKVRSEMSVLVASSELTSKVQKTPSKYLKVAFIQVDEINKGVYVENELNIWKAAHANLEADGVQDWWAVYKLEYPHGTSVNYQFITISAVSSFAKLNQLDYLRAYKKAQPSRDFDEDVRNTLAIRSAYRAELWELVDFLEK